MNEQLIKALAELDPANDEHWTRDGLPRVDAVAALSGLTGLKRGDLEAAAPGFSRESPQFAEIGAGNGQTSPSELDTDSQISAWQARRDDLKRQIAESRREREAAHRRELEMQAELDQLTLKIESAVPAPKPQEIIQTYIKSENELRAQRVAEEPVDGRAPIDKALAASRGRGAGRPNYPPQR